MQHFELEDDPSRRFAGKVCFLSGALLLLWLTGCGGNTTSSVPPTSPAPPLQGPQTYFAPFIAGTTNKVSSGVAGNLPGPETYAFDDSADTFSQNTFGLQPPLQGPQVINSGMFTASSRGLLSLGTMANYVSNGSTYLAMTYNPPKTGNFAVELAGQAGGLVQLVGQPVAPLVAAVQCPNLATAQTYQFLTIPAALMNSSAGQQAFTWDPATDTAYGSVDISTSGSTVNFNNIHQFTLPSAGGTGAPAHPASSSVAGACAPTFFGNTITLPNPLIITNPGSSNPPQVVPPSATAGIGPSGLLVEDNGAEDASVSDSATSPPPYNTVLGAGTGAVGLPKPSSALDTGALLGAQYLGFIYGAGVYSVSSTGWSSHLGSFGFSSVPSSCASVAANSGTLIYGGDYTNDDPSTSSSGFGNCDLAIDLGTQDASNNGLYPKATVWLGASYAANTTGKTYSFPAVVIAGQLNGKFALFLLGADSTQPWAIYLLQSN
jgi:hypothetical protein